ncbi:mRNA interferase [Bacteroidia bacterium]|nr:mRNA interferase [Bacteroidia bacterium]
MTFEQFDIWLADLSPQMGTESGKVRPVLVIQTNLLNQISHASVIICPITTNTVPNTQFLRVHLQTGMAHLHQDCDIMIDQIRAIDAKRLIKKLGTLPYKLVETVKSNLRIMLDLDEN